MKKILWIDDDNAFSDSIKDVLIPYFHFFKVDRLSGFEPLLEYDAVVMDLTFAEELHWRVLRDLRASAKGSALPLLAILSRPPDLSERLKFNELHIAHTDKWTSLWMIRQKIEALFA